MSRVQSLLQVAVIFAANAAVHGARRAELEVAAKVAAHSHAGAHEHRQGLKKQKTGFLLERRARRMRAAQPFTPPPTLGVQNVTTPTGVPPPPPMLDAWNDMQPADTALGNRFVSGLLEDPTITPPPTQEALNLAFACPVLLTWPANVVVDVPNGMMQTAGNWSSNDNSRVLTWTRTCTSLSFSQYQTPLVSYSMPNGDLFGTSQQQSTVWGTETELRDCAGNIKYVIREKVYHQSGEPDAQACQDYGSCDGIVYIQHFIHDSDDNIIAMTPYTTLFQNSYKITSPGGMEIAEISRVDDWNPTTAEPEAQPKWLIRFSENAPGVFSAVSEQWPIAEMVTMNAFFDTFRQSTGLLRPSACEVRKSVCFAVVVFLMLFVFGACFVLFTRVCLHPCRHAMYKLEVRTCPTRMRKPSRFDES